MSTLTLSTVTDFYHRHENKLIFVIVLLLSLYLVAFAAKMTWQLMPQKEQTSQNAMLVQNAQNNTSQTRTADISNILALNLFGDAEAVEVEPSNEAITDVPETKLNLVLSGVVLSSDPKLGAAVVAYRNTQGTYGVGDKIDGTNVTLDEIYADRVIIKNRVTRETLMLEGIDFDEANRNRNRALQNSRQQSTVGPSQEQTVATENQKAVQEARQKLQQSPQNFAELISLRPHRSNGEFIGFRVSPGPKPALFNTLGLKNGDVATELNGIDLSDVSRIQEAVVQLRQADYLQLEIIRDGEPMSLSIDIPSENTP
ncbi:type II secretion system protein GspC [Glaciecola petra]|uniref:Type II secretion system protein GspC n=1 Tax=Glaciecola petra TaxID=3075602 RepID=A0ABU2ZUV8_9ALTE|nr:type II secretion system protein GspC [Aestuariibacter sp. P117]MDT0595207.1 type II secretion system protein GspC [Aestuariibacter sp. P117]